MDIQLLLSLSKEQLVILCDQLIKKSKLTAEKTLGETQAIFGFVGNWVCIDVPDMDLTCEGELSWHNSLNDTLEVSWENGNFSFHRKHVLSERVEEGNIILTLSKPQY